jgi:hypothetical protein|tara:strand:+ start:508 stop:1038 length:531 start_codon:yes stop_codon:yes gene_type:complete
MTIEEICKKYGISNYVINDDVSIDVDGDVDLNDCELTELPLTFNKVTGTFNCDDNKLTSLEGSSEYIDRDFRCFHNELTSLKGSPKHIGGNLFCSHNKLTSLENNTEYLGIRLYLNNNPVYSILSGNVEYEHLTAFNSFKIIKDGVVNLKRLKYFHSIFDLDTIDLDSMKKFYKIV